MTVSFNIKPFVTLGLTALLIATINGCVNLSNTAPNTPLESSHTRDTSSNHEKSIADSAKTNLQRIKIATVGAINTSATTKLYEQWLDYQQVESGLVSNAMAKNWGTPAMVGKPWTLLQGKSGDDVYLRVIEVDWVDRNYKAMTTHGWNAIEMIVENPDRLYNTLLNSPFQHIGGPANLGGSFETIRAVQFKGPSEEIFYFTTDTAEDKSNSPLMSARTNIDRPFIMVVAGADARKIMDFYTNNLDAVESFYSAIPINVVSTAQNLPASHPFPLGLVRLGQFSNSIEIDGYPNTSSSRPTAQGQLPPGVSITTFSVRNLDDINSDLFVSAPKILEGKAYNGNRVATIIGPAGEFIELIEEKK